jgi:hypothetical protein
MSIRAPISTKASADDERAELQVTCLVQKMVATGTITARPINCHRRILQSLASGPPCASIVDSSLELGAKYLINEPSKFDGRTVRLKCRCRLMACPSNAIFQRLSEIR